MSTRKTLSILSTAMTALLIYGAASSGFAGSEMKEYKEPAPVDMFRAGEIQFNLYGAGGYGEDEDIVTEKRTVTERRSETEVRFQTRRVVADRPRTADPILNAILTAVERRTARIVTEPVFSNRTKREKTSKKTTRNDAEMQGGFIGGGIEGKYFVTRNLGLGLEGDGLSSDDGFGLVKGTVTVRFPVASTAPYLMAGAGIQYGNRTQAIGSVGGGVEHRFSPECGVFADAAYQFGENQNAAFFRLGVTVIR